MRHALGEFNFLGRATDDLQVFTATLAGTGTALVVEALAMPGTPGAAAEVTHPALVEAIVTELDRALREGYRQNLDAVEARFRAARLKDVQAAKVAGNELERLFAVIHSPGHLLVHARGTNHDRFVPIRDRFVPIRDHLVPDMLDKLIDVFSSSFISRAPPGPYNERRYIITALPECFHELMMTTLWLGQT